MDLAVGPRDQGFEVASKFRFGGEPGELRPRTRRSASDFDDLAALLLAYVRSNPGKRGEQIAQALGTDTGTMRSRNACARVDRSTWSRERVTSQVVADRLSPTSTGPRASSAEYPATDSHRGRRRCTRQIALSRGLS